MAVTYECASAVRAAARRGGGPAPAPHPHPAGQDALRPASPCGRPATALEVFGGNGYMEDWPMARQLRDAQCHTIWEGTENILCIDVRRAMRGEHAHVALLARIDRALEAAVPTRCWRRRSTRSRRRWKTARRAVDHLAACPTTWRCSTAVASPSCWPTRPRGASWSKRRPGSLGRDGDARKAAVARRFAAGGWRRPPVRGHPRRRPDGPRPLRAVWSATGRSGSTTWAAEPAYRPRVPAADRVSTP